MRVSIEKNVVDLDPGDIGTVTNDINLEVRVDNVGGINAGPMFLNVDLENDKQVVEVTFQADGQTEEGHDRVPVKFSWHFGDQAQPRYWMVYTGDPPCAPKFKYQVRVLVKGSVFTKGKEWIGPWQDGSGNGPLMISVPTPEDDGVVTRSITPTMIGASPAPAQVPPAPTALVLTPPPATSGPASPGGPPPRPRARWSSGSRTASGRTMPIPRPAGMSPSWCRFCRAPPNPTPSALTCGAPG